MQQPPCRARDERLELPGSAGAGGHLPVSHRASRPEDDGLRDSTTTPEVSYQARGGPSVKSPVRSARESPAGLHP
ncbi:hypothetical protein GCM10010301_04170 [Streptomyces plicatus]|nr:hypothetical protein GCM10010301_04170 [Streptomyces plicatus]